MGLEWGKRSVLTVVLASALGSLAIGQTWEVYDEELTLVRKIENENINILGNSVRVSTGNNSLNLLGKNYETIVAINDAKVFQYLEPWIIVEQEGKYGAYHEYGEKIFDTEYDVIDTYYNLLLAKKGIAYFLYDRGQKEVKPLGSYESAHIAKNGQIIARDENVYYLPLSENPSYAY